MLVPLAKALGLERGPQTWPGSMTRKSWDKETKTAAVPLTTPSKLPRVPGKLFIIPNPE